MASTKAEIHPHFYRPDSICRAFHRFGRNNLYVLQG